MIAFKRCLKNGTSWSLLNSPSRESDHSKQASASACCKRIHSSCRTVSSRSTNCSRRSVSIPLRSDSMASKSKEWSLPKKSFSGQGACFSSTVVLMARPCLLFAGASLSVGNHRISFIGTADAANSCVFGAEELRGGIQASNSLSHMIGSSLCPSKSEPSQAGLLLSKRFHLQRKAVLPCQAAFSSRVGPAAFPLPLPFPGPLPLSSGTPLAFPAAPFMDWALPRPGAGAGAGAETVTVAQPEGGAESIFAGFVPTSSSAGAGPLPVLPPFASPFPLLPPLMPSCNGGTPFAPFPCTGSGPPSPCKGRPRRGRFSLDCSSAASIALESAASRRPSVSSAAGWAVCKVSGSDSGSDCFAPTLESSAALLPVLVTTLLVEMQQVLSSSCGCISLPSGSGFCFCRRSSGGSAEGPCSRPVCVEKSSLAS
mmetsp:Transcript_15789/g.37144  ORF Transcript_15789/g.37144 Transcript_15789/m.37144 type:complete len:426 (+) Transcript_15789:1082-2359(+)